MKLIFFFILIDISLENCDYYHYFDNDNNIKCTFDNSCPLEFNKLIPKKKECTKDCKKDPIYRYEYKNECIEKCPSPETELIKETYCIEISIKRKMYKNHDENSLLKTETKHWFNFQVLSYNVFGDFKNLQSNIGFYALAIVIFVFIIIMILFCIKGFTLFNNKMNDIIKKNFDNNEGMNPPKKTGDKTHTKEKRSKTHTRQKVKKRGKKKDKSLRIKNDTTNDFMNNKQKNNTIRGNISNNINNNILPGNQYIYYPETDYELNWLSFNDAVKYDKRQCCDYYCALIKTKQILLLL